jgi:hypothetical protein
MKPEEISTFLVENMGVAEDALPGMTWEKIVAYCRSWERKQVSMVKETPQPVLNAKQKREPKKEKEDKVWGWALRFWELNKNEPITLEMIQDNFGKGYAPSTVGEWKVWKTKIDPENRLIRGRCKMDRLGQADADVVDPYQPPEPDF